MHMWMHIGQQELCQAVRVDRLVGARKHGLCIGLCTRKEIYKTDNMEFEMPEPYQKKKLYARCARKMGYADGV